MIRAQNLTFSYGAGPVFDMASFTVAKNQTVGLVGPNGAGKSTLLRILTEQEQESGGSIEIDGTIGYVPQEIKKDKKLQTSQSISDYIDPNHTQLDHEKKKLLHAFALNLSLASSPTNLSGGQKTKLAIIRNLIEEPDILLLDEPTNFLDVKEKKWAMNILADYPKTLLIISHDLDLLNQVLEKVLHINTVTHKIEEYKGNYTEFKRLQKEKEEHLVRQIKQEQQHIRRMEEGLKKLQGRKSEKGVRQKIQLKKRIEKAKVGLPEIPIESRKIKINLTDPAPIGELPVNLKNVSKSFDDHRIIKNFSFYINRGERVALLGPNGAGKSTLIKIIMQILKPDTGQIKIDSKAKIGYYAQDMNNLPMDRTVFDVADHHSDFGEHRLRPYLARFLFTGDKIFQKIESLSGGEKTRLAIALILLHNYNVLILDEPTTYLDPLSQRVILESLKEYEGTLLIVSHTKEFIEELHPDRAVLMPENKIQFYSKELLEKIEEM